MTRSSKGSNLSQREYVSSVLVSIPTPMDLRLNLLATEDKILLEYFLYRRRNGHIMSLLHCFLTRYSDNVHKLSQNMASPNQELAYTSNNTSFTVIHRASTCQRTIHLTSNTSTPTFIISPISSCQICPSDH